MIEGMIEAELLINGVIIALVLASFAVRKMRIKKTVARKLQTISIFLASSLLLLVCWVFPVEEHQKTLSLVLVCLGYLFVLIRVVSYVVYHPAFRISHVHTPVFSSPSIIKDVPDRDINIIGDRLDDGVFSRYIGVIMHGESLVPFQMEAGQIIGELDGTPIIYSNVTHIGDDLLLLKGGGKSPVRYNKELFRSSTHHGYDFESEEALREVAEKIRDNVKFLFKDGQDILAYCIDCSIDSEPLVVVSEYENIHRFRNMVRYNTLTSSSFQRLRGFVAGRVSLYASRRAVSHAETRKADAVTKNISKFLIEHHEKRKENIGLAKKWLVQHEAEIKDTQSLYDVVKKAGVDSSFSDALLYLLATKRYPAIKDFAAFEDQMQKQMLHDAHTLFGEV
ncbi:MAG: hypothetical protein CMM94_06595 [Rickettsiales bacterium]|nr:hypothetical protein [Rickettsiales bacterium]